jgi:two-component system, OmpR family, copper resistance phosphate regulon response regulator CusR
MFATSMLKVLVIEDEPKVSSFIRQGLEENGYEVDVAFDGMLGLRFASTNNYDIILLDIIIPLINGIELCRKLREINTAVPVLMLTALGTTKDKVDGLEAGADDYLVKPFEFDELLARIKSLTRRTKGLHETSKFIKVGDLTLDMDKQLAKRDGKTIMLTAKEFSLLEYLMKNKGRVISRIELTEKVWGLNFDTGTNVVDVYMNLLRKKIDKDFANKMIQTRIGLGYMLNET